MTHLILDTPKTFRFPAIRLPKLAIGKLFAAIAGGFEAYGAAKVSVYGTAMGFGTSPNTTAKRDDDY